MLTDYFFWFVQPGSMLNNLDMLFGYKFAGLFLLAIIVWIANRFVTNPVVRKLLKKVQIFAFTVSIFGLIWFGFRYEVTPIFARRYWAGLVFMGELVWLVFILKYLILNFPKDKDEYARLEVKNKYIPKPR